MDKYDECELTAIEYTNSGTTVESFEDEFDGVKFYYVCKINGVSCRSEIKYLSHKAAVDAGREFIDTHKVVSPFNKWLYRHNYEVRSVGDNFYWVARFYGENLTSDAVDSLTLADSNGREFLCKIYDLENNQKEATK